MERITTRLPGQQGEGIEQLVESDESPTRSEAVRQAVREFVTDRETDQETDRPSRNWANG